MKPIRSQTRRVILPSWFQLWGLPSLWRAAKCFPGLQIIEVTDQEDSGASPHWLSCATCLDWGSQDALGVRTEMKFAVPSEIRCAIAFGEHAGSRIWITGKPSFWSTLLQRLKLMSRSPTSGRLKSEGDMKDKGQDSNGVLKSHQFPQERASAHGKAECTWRFSCE